MKTFANILVAFVLGAGSSCSENMPVASSDATKEAVPPKLETEKLDKSDSWVIYRSVLSAIRNNYAFGKTLVDEINPKELLVYGNETVSPRPDSLARLQSEANLSAELLGNFRVANANSANLEADYEVLDWTKRDNVGEDPEKFFHNAQKVRPELKAVVNLSNIGVDLKNDMALAYVDYYGQSLGRSRFYLLMQFERSTLSDPPGIAHVRVVRAHKEP